MRKLLLALVLALLCHLGSPASGLAQPQQASAEASSSPIAGWSAQLDSVAETIIKPELPDTTLSLLRDELEILRNETRAWISEQTPKVLKA